MESTIRDLLTRLATILGNPDADTDADDLIEVFGDLESNRVAVSQQLAHWLESDSD